MRKLVLFLFISGFVAGCQNMASNGAGSQNDDLFALKQQAALAYSEKRYAEALPLFQKLNREVPSDALLWLRTGNVHARLNQPVEAISSYEQAVKFDSQLAKAWHNMGIIQLRQAANTFTQMVQHLNPGDPLYQRAVTLSEAALSILSVGREQTSGTE